MPVKFNTFTGIAFAGLEILPETLQVKRIDDPEKRWKFERNDLKVRERFDKYPGRLGRGDHRDLDCVGSVARRPGRPELGQGAGDRGAARGGARSARPAALPPTDPAIEGLRVT